MTGHHRKAVAVIAAAAVLDAGSGLAYAMAEHIGWPDGLYWALQTATTVGYGDLPPRTAGGHLVAALVMLTVVPLFAATFSLFTSGLTAIDLGTHHAAIHARLNEIGGGRGR